MAEPSEIDILENILALVTRMEATLRLAYTSMVGGMFVASLNDPVLRQPNARAVRTLIVNLGPEPLDIYENNHLVQKQLNVNETWVSALAGSGTIKAMTEGAGSNISLVTYIL